MAVPPQTETMDQQIVTPSKKKRARRNNNRGRGNKNASSSSNHGKNPPVGGGGGSDGEGSSSGGSSAHGGRTRRRHRTTAAATTTTTSKQLHQQELTHEEQAQYVAMDCEMVGVGDHGRTSSIARVTLIDWNGNTIMDEYVRQDREVTDYRTFVSGITREHLETATTTLDECRCRVMVHLAGKILVGHALKNDLKALGVHHPWQRTRDTAKYESFMQVRFDDGILWPRKLRDLAHEKLHREIQVQGRSHSPHEDAMAALDLYKLVRNKFERVMEYKIQKTREIEQKGQHPPQQQQQQPHTVAVPIAVA